MKESSAAFSSILWVPGPLKLVPRKGFSSVLDWWFPKYEPESGKFVAVMVGGKIATSFDGIKWHEGLIQGFAEKVAE